jgi:pimeloyl-ACP methyl ester carboxylesterase
MLLGTAGYWTTRGLAMASPTEAANPLERLQSGYADSSLGARIYYQVVGNPKGPAVYMTTLSPGNDRDEKTRNSFLRVLGRRYKVLMADYPFGLGRSDRPPDPARLTAEQVCRDFLTVADTAGIDRFAVTGYSWGGNACLRLAASSDRITALAVGGWPALDGPFEESLEATREIAKATEKSGNVPGIKGPPSRYWQQFVTYYESLQGWDERGAVAGLTCPRLNFVDDMDSQYDMVKKLRDNESALTELGWEVAFVDSGMGHMGGFRPEVAAPLIASFLDRHLLAESEPGK